MSAEQTPDIERVLAEHALSYVAQIGNVWGWSCTCPAISKNAEQTSKGLAIASHARHVAQALAPFLAAAVREAEQRAWDEGFDAGERDVIDHQTDGDWSRPCIANPYRADRVAEPQHEAATSGKEAVSEPTGAVDWRDLPHVHAGTDCAGGPDCPARSNGEGA